MTASRHRAGTIRRHLTSRAALAVGYGAVLTLVALLPVTNHLPGLSDRIAGTGDSAELTQLRNLEQTLTVNPDTPLPDGLARRHAADATLISTPATRDGCWTLTVPDRPGRPSHLDHTKNCL